MKSVIALAFAAGALAVPAWSDAPVDGATTTTTTTSASTTWADYPVKPTTTSTTTSYDPWKDDPLKGKTTTTTTTTGYTWADYTSSTTKPVKDTSSTTTTSATWADYTPTVTTTVTDTITTYCSTPTAWVHKGESDSCTAGESKTLTKGPYTITIEVSYETSTVCTAKPTSSTPAAASSTGSWADVPVDATATPSKPVSPVSRKFLHNARDEQFLTSQQPLVVPSPLSEPTLALPPRWPAVLLPVLPPLLLFSCKFRDRLDRMISRMRRYHKHVCVL
jgi:hypothetical protein